MKANEKFYLSYKDQKQILSWHKAKYLLLCERGESCSRKEFKCELESFAKEVRFDLDKVFFEYYNDRKFLKSLLEKAKLLVRGEWCL